MQNTHHSHNIDCRIKNIWQQNHLNDCISPNTGRDFTPAFPHTRLDRYLRSGYKWFAALNPYSVHLCKININAWLIFKTSFYGQPVCLHIPGLVLQQITHCTSHHTLHSHKALLDRPSVSCLRTTAVSEFKPVDVSEKQIVLRSYKAFLTLMCFLCKNEWTL